MLSLKTPLALLHPLPAADPLAELFNDWLRGLAYVERLTSPRPSGKSDAEDERTRQLLRNATADLHAVHHAFSKAIALLEKGAPLAKLARLFQEPGSRPVGIGSHFAESFEPLTSYVALQARMSSRAEFKRVLRYSHAYRIKQAAQAVLESPLERTVGLFMAVFDASIKAEQDFCFLQPNDAAGRAELLGLLRSIVALDCFELVQEPHS